MNILLISKSEKPCLTSFPVWNIIVFVRMASCNVYYNFQDCISIALFRILYVIEYFIPSQNWMLLLTRYQGTSLSEKKDLSVCI